MKWGIPIALVLAGCLTAGPSLRAQSPPAAPAPESGQNKPAGDAQKPAAAQPQPGSNPFPEDTSTVPVMPSKGAPALPEGTYTGDESRGVPLPSEDLDPVRSPDDPAQAADSGQEHNFSSSRSELDKMLPGPDDEQTDNKKRKLTVKEPTHQEAASNDIDVGNYYVQTRNWRAAISRFQSAMVLDSDNPDVYWGLAEAERHLGNFADARAHYQKVVDYDPDSRHGKDARKALKEPEIANAQNAAHGQSTAETPK